MKDLFIAQLNGENETAHEQAQELRAGGRHAEAGQLELEEADRTIAALEAHYGADAL